MKYKVGDKVRIKEDLTETSDTKYIVNKHMLQWAGKVCTISEVYDDCYLLLEDPSGWYWTDDMFTKSRREWVWGRGVSTTKVKEMTTSHIKNSITLLRKMNPDEMLEDGHLVKEWIDTFTRELAYRKMSAIKDDPVKQYMDKDIELTEQFIIKENKENIKMTNTDLIQNKLEKELEALDKARLKEIKNEFYKTTIGKAAKAFNEALEELYIDEYHRSFRIDEDQLMGLEQQRYVAEINEHYNAKREEVKEYYREAIALFENADTYEQKHEILTAYGILKGPKTTKVKVEGVEK